MLKEKTLFIFGAGFSVNLGLPTTSGLDNIVNILCEKGTSIEERIEKIKRNLKIDKTFKEDLKTTLIILLDDNNKSEEEARQERKK